MPFAEWEEDKYAIGVDRVDEQHQRLFELINELYDTMRSDEEVQVGPILNDLEEYTYFHFDDEQEFMTECGFADDCGECFKAHQQAHRTFEEEVSRLKELHENGDATVHMKTLRFLRSWLSEHVGDIDQQIGVYLEEGREDLEPKEMSTSV